MPSSLAYPDKSGQIRTDPDTTWAGRLPNSGRNNLSKMAEEKEVTGYTSYATPGASPGNYARRVEEMAITGVGGKWRIVGHNEDRVTWSGDTDMVV